MSTVINEGDFMNEFKNFNHDEIQLLCKNCKDNSELIYDSHHDQIFCKTCGTVIYEAGHLYYSLSLKKLQLHVRENKHI